MNLHMNAIQQKPAFNLIVKESFPILQNRLALSGILVAPLGSAEDVCWTTRAIFENSTMSESRIHGKRPHEQ